MNYLVTFFRERFYKGNEFIVLKPYYEVHLCVIMISFIGIGPIIAIDIWGAIRNGFSSFFSIDLFFPTLLVLIIFEFGLLIIFECQYVKITGDEIKVVELFFIHKTMKLADILEKEVIAGNVGFRIASKNDEIIIKIFHLSKNDINILYKKIGYESKKK